MKNKNEESTKKNKMVAVALVLLGLLPILIDGDASVLVLTLIFGLPLFFAKENYIM